MADSSGYGAWSKVPTWDGYPLTWRSFKRKMAWWVSSLDFEATKRYHLAARWLLRQTGTVRQRGDKFSPSELKYQKGETLRDPETGEELVSVVEDPLAGLNKLMDALDKAFSTNVANCARNSISICPGR